MSASAEWSYAEYRGKEDGRAEDRRSHLTQQYSLLYEKEGKWRNGRAGAYSLALGYEYNVLDSDIGGQKIDLTSDKFLFQGNMVLAPGGLPFRLVAYSRDMHRTSFQRDDYLVLGLNQNEESSAVIDPDIVTNIHNGSYIETGVTLFAGISNGSYLGRYRKVLSQLPRLLVDFRQVDVKDTISLAPQHYRQRDLAFVSLNKKNNWIHYRLTDYTDYLNSATNYWRKEFMLGTIDHELKRHWINLTNWIKVSADLSYVENMPSQSVEQNRPPEELYNLNLFAAGERTTYRGTAYTTFQRRREGSEISTDLEVPFFASGDLSRQTSWRFQWIGSQERDEKTGEWRRDRNSAYATMQLEAFREGRYILRPTLSAEVKGGGYGEGQAAKATVEYFSNTRYSPLYDIYTSYSLLYLTGTARTGSDVGYWEQELSLGAQRDFGSRTRLEMSQDVLFGTGRLDRTVAHHIKPRGDMGTTGSVSARDQQARRGQVWKLRTRIAGDFRAHSGLKNRLALTYEFLQTDQGNDSVFLLTHRLDYRKSKVDLSIENELKVGDRLEVNSVPLENLQSSSSGGAKTAFDHRTRLSYQPNRANEASVDMNYQWRDLGGESTTTLSVQQRYAYSLYTINGIIRKLAQIEEEIDYERYSAFGDSGKGLKFTLTGVYMPFRQTALGLITSWQKRDSGAEERFVWRAYANITFSKLSLRLTYSEGFADRQNNVPDREDRRWSLDIKKVF